VVAVVVAFDAVVVAIVVGLVIAVIGFAVDVVVVIFILPFRILGVDEGVDEGLDVTTVFLSKGLPSLLVTSVVGGIEEITESFVEAVIFLFEEIILA